MSIPKSILAGIVLLPAALSLMTSRSQADTSRAGTSRADTSRTDTSRARFKLLRSRAKQALETLAPPEGKLIVRWALDRPTPVLIRGLQARVPGESSEARARAFLGRHPHLFAAVGSRLRYVETRSTRELEAVRFQQHHMGVPVESATIVVALDGAGRVRAVRSRAVSVALASVSPRLDADQAIRIAARKVSPGRAGGAGGAASLAITTGGTTRLIYSVRLPFDLDPKGRRHLVDALTGEYSGWRHGVLIDGQRPRGEVRR